MLRLLYVGDTGSPHFRAWPSHFAAAGLEVHTLHTGPRPPGEPIEGATAHPPARSGPPGVRGAWLAGAASVRSLTRRLRPDLVHSHQVVPAGVLTDLGWRGPHVATAWGSEVMRAGRAAKRPIARAVRRADLITADSHHLLDELERRGARRERLRWVPWGVSESWSAPALAASPADAAARLGLPAGRPIVLSHRGTRDLYRQDVFIRAVADLRRGGLDVAGVVIELHPDPAANRSDGLRRLAEEHGVADAIDLIPPLPHPEMALAFRAASVCVSVPETDSAPTSVFEALSVGTPAIVSDLPWVHEPIHRDARLAVVPVGDHAALAEAIERAVRRPSEGDAAANRDLVRRHFDRERIFSGVMPEYERLAGGPRS